MLQIRNLSKVFNEGTVNEKIVFNKLNLKVEQGQFVTIIGSNGAGKSTLLNIISGSIKPDEGTIAIGDNIVNKLSEFKSSRFIGRVFQNPSSGVAPNMTILENMSMAHNKGKAFNLTPGASKKNISSFKEMLSELNLGLEDKLYTKVAMLSGGQRQALSLLMSVMNKPKVLLLDEHTAALDPKTSQRINEITEKIIKENKITTMMVTHNLNHAINMGDRLIMMHQGEIVLDAAGEDKVQLTIPKLLEYFDQFKGGESLSDVALFS